MKDKNYASSDKASVSEMQRMIQLQGQTVFQLKSLLDNVPGDIYWKSKDGVWLGLNTHCLHSLVRMGIINSANEHEVIGKTDYELFNKITADAYTANDEEVIRTNSELSTEENTYLKNGELIILHSIKKPLYDEENNLVGIIGNTIDITAMKRIEKELKEAKEIAEMANKAKDEFIANMSHDIRTPLTGVIGLSEMLEQTLSNPADKEKAHMLHDSGAQLLHLLNHILEDIRAETSTNHDLVFETFNVRNCIQELIRLESSASALKGLTILTEISPEVPEYICSDRTKIHRVLLNLMSNAIKFTQSGHITLQIDCLQKDANQVHLKFSVQDTGIGIPDEIQTHLFDRFYKASSSYQGVYEGHGLGLHIAQSFVQLLGGKITLTSIPNQGSTFHFDISCAIGDAPTVTPVNATPAAAMPDEKKTGHLLLVEDNTIALKTLEFLLKSKGYTFVSAVTAERAWEILQTDDFDAIITDIGLPGMSGMDLSNRIRHLEKQSHKTPTPIIALTGHAKEVASEKCQAQGINEVFCKPVPMEELHACLQKLIHKPLNPSDNELSKEDSTSKQADILVANNEPLFELQSFPLFDETFFLQQIPDKPLLISLIKDYLSETMQQDIQEIQNLHAVLDWSGIEKIVHKIKGGLLYLGTQKMRYACQYFGTYQKAGHTELLEPLFQQILLVNKDTIEALRYWLETGDGQK